MIDILLGYITGILANITTDKINKSTEKVNNGKVLTSQLENREIHLQENEIPKTFAINSLSTSFINSDTDMFVSLLKSIYNPNIYVFIEASPSTYYNLGIVVIEDNRTKDWYLFDRPVAFQGSGGGWSNTKSFYNIIKEQDDNTSRIALSIRISTNENITKLKNGYLLWSEFKDYSIPAMMTNDSFLKQFQNRFNEELVNKK